MRQVVAQAIPAPSPLVGEGGGRGGPRRRRGTRARERPARYDRTMNNRVRRLRQLTANVRSWLRQLRPGRRFRAALPWTGIVAFAAVAVLAVVVLPPFFSPDLDDAQAQFEVRDRARLTVAALIGGFVLLVGAYINWRRVRALEGQVTTMERQVTTLQLGQITERFTRAIDQLGAVRPDGKPADEIRAGGVRSLERIAGESEDDFWPVLDILTAYLRTQNSWVPPEVEGVEPLYDVLSAIRDRMDIAFAVDAVGRLWPDAGEAVPTPLNLSWTYVPELALPGKHLRNASLARTQLWRANLRGADLREANLEGATLEEARLGQADLEKANLEGARLDKASLEKANLAGADLRNASLRHAGLWGADLRSADLRYAHLEDAKLMDANLDDALLDGATYDKRTEWPKGFTPPDPAA